MTRVGRAAALPSRSGAAKFARYGLPFVVLCVASYWGLSKFVNSKYEALDSRVKRQSERSVLLEEEHKKAMAMLANEDFVLRPVPRPADESDSPLR